MALYKTFNIKFYDYTADKEGQYYEVATNIAAALSKFYDEMRHEGRYITQILDIWEDDMKFGYVLTDDEGDQFWYGFPNESALFYDLSKTLAFDDCCPEFTLDAIKCGGRSVRYTGWKPGLRMQYKFNDNGGEEIAWDQCYPQFDH